MSDEMEARVRVRGQVLGCTNCGLRSGCQRPVPFSGDNPAPIVVIGEAPGQEENETGKPFVGPAGRFLRMALDGVMEVPGWNEGLGFVNVVSCHPARTPTADEVRACGENLNQQLHVLDPWYCLVLGGVACGAFWPRLRVGECRGRWWSEDGSWGQLPAGESTVRRVWMLATVHPSAVLRAGGSTSKMGGLFHDDLRLFRDTIMDWRRPGLNVDCVKCGRGDRRGMAEIWERNMGACLKHAEQAGVGVGGASGSVSSARSRQGGERRKPANPYVTSRPRRGQSSTPGTLFG